MEKNNVDKEVFEVRSKCADRLTAKEAKQLFMELHAPDCPYKTLNIRTVISSEISELLYKALLKNKSIISIFGVHSFAHESTYLKALKKNPDLPLKSLVLSCPMPPKLLVSIFKRKRQLTRLSLEVFHERGTPATNRPKWDMDEVLEAISSNITTLEHFSISLGLDIEVSPGTVENVLRNNQGLRSVSINIYEAFKCHHRMILKRLLAIGLILAKLPLLTSLKFVVYKFDGESDTAAFLEGLKGNKTITELHLNQYWIGLDSKELIEHVLSLKALKILRLKGFSGLEYYKNNVNENNLIDVSRLFDSQSQLVEIECNFTPFVKEKLFAALKTNTNLRRIYIDVYETHRMIMRLSEELDNRLDIDIYHLSTDDLPYELLLDHHLRSTRRKNYLAIKNNLQVISAARDRGLFDLLPQEVLVMIWYEALCSIAPLDITLVASTFEKLGERYRK